MCQTDGQYVQRCLNGEPDAFRHLVLCHQGRLLSFLTGRLGEAEQAAEAAQETFVRAYFALPKLKKPDSFLPWLLGIAGRVAKETYRDKQRRRQVAALRRDGGPDQADPPDPALSRAVSELPEAYRKVILLRYYGGLSCAEIGLELGVPLGTVTKRLSRAYTLLRELLPKQ